MDRDSRNAAIAALVIMLVFGFGWYFMPTIMREIGSVSPAIAGIVAVLFVAAFFLVFWFRARRQRR